MFDLVLFLFTRRSIFPFGEAKSYTKEKRFSAGVSEECDTRLVSLNRRITVQPKGTMIMNAIVHPIFVSKLNYLPHHDRDKLVINLQNENI